MKHLHRSFSCGQAPTPWRFWLVLCALCAFSALVSSSAANAAPRLLSMTHLAKSLGGARPLGRIDATRTLSPEIVLPLRDKPGLDALIKRLYDPKDALYGHYLKPSEFTDRFGPTVADVNAVAAWAQSKGLRVASISPNRTLIKVTGPSRLVETAFGVQVNTFTAADGRSVYAPDRAITIPTEIASRVLNVVGLDNVAKAHTFLRQTAAHTPGAADAASSFAGAVPAQINGSGVGGDLSPYDVHTIYNIPSGTGYDGYGQHLGLFELDGYTASDITTFENQYTGGNVTITPESVDGFSTNPTDNGIIPEVTLDIDMELAMAPAASQITVYEGPGDSEGFQTLILDIFTQIANDDSCNVISVSYGLSEDSFSTSDMISDDNEVSQMVSQGQEMCVSSGDAGAYTDQSVSTPNTSNPGSLYYVTSVGGTYLTDSSSYPYTYVSESSWADTSDKGRGPIGTGGGGGVSSIWATPYWQAPVINTSVNPQASTTYRNVPDVSLYGDYDEGGYSIYLTPLGGSGGWYGYNGTSASSPLWAGFLAVVNEQREYYHNLSALGFAGPALYEIGANNGTQGAYGRDFHDINDGSNNLFYNAVSGYDNSTGLGSINGVTLIQDLSTINTGGPPNDNFAGSIGVSADPANPATVYGSNFGATFESGEPDNVRNTGEHTVWWNWTCPASGTATITTTGSDFDTTLGIYTGTAVNSLTQVASDDDYNGTVQSGVSFACTAGTVYQISVDGYGYSNGPSEGNVVLNISQTAPPPSNDNFASAYTVYGTPAQSSTNYGSNYGATQESGEPLNTSGSGGHSVWWVWTAPGTGTATIDTFGSSYDTTLGVYTGTAVNALTQVASDDDAGGTVQSQVTFSAVAGTVYYISVDGFYTREGNIKLDVAETGVAAPGNDNFVNRYTINAAPGSPGTATGNNAAATSEAGEPLNTNFSGGHSIWWQWTAPVTNSVTIDTFGSNFDTTLGVYTGSAVNALTQVASDDDAGGTLQSQVTFSAVAGTTYTISVDGYAYHEGNVTLHVTQGYPSPTITSFSPTSGTAGTNVTITGTNFTGTTNVAFNGTAASFGVNSDTQITATVPAGATTGTITVSNPGGTATSASSFTVPLPPTITSFTPTSGPAGTSVVITGANLTGASSVKFHGTAATSYTVNSSTQITAAVPSGATTGTITITTPSGTATSAGSFTVFLPPTITSFTPTSGPVGTTVVITGTNLTGTTVVGFTGAHAAFTVNSATQITATVPSGAATGTIALATPGGTVHSSATFTVTTVSVPTITSFTPTSGPVGTNVTITGTNFTGATAVKFHGTTATYTVHSATQITATVPSGATTGTITVTTAGGTATSSASFTVTTVPAPTVSSFTPASGPVGTVVTINGTHLNGVNAVRFNSADATTFSANGAGTQITVTVPTGALSGKIRVTTPGGSVQTATSFTVTVAVPTITSFTPTSGPVGTSVAINGTHLNGATVVGFTGAHATSFTVNGAGTQITTTVPSGAATGTIAVATPGGTAHSSASFTVTTVSVPTITSFSPTSGPVGTNVTITGTNFTGASSVKFHGTTATTFHVATATQITATVPSGATTGTLTVTTAGGTATSSASFTVTASAPTITSFTPMSGPVGTTVVITGTNLTGTTVVGFTGAHAAFTVNSATQITATVPSGANTGTIAVGTPGGTAHSSGTFTVTAASVPTITSFSPTSGPVGTSVTITGTHFTGASSVKFHGTTATTFHVVSATQITATVPSGATTGTITVTTAGGTATSSASFTVTASAPTITSFSPTSGPVGTTVIITGTNLTGTTVVGFTGAHAAFTVNSSTQITATVPSGANTGTIAVGTPGGIAHSSGTFTVH